MKPQAGGSRSRNGSGCFDRAHQKSAAIQFCIRDAIFHLKNVGDFSGWQNLY
jgi:hypothetical protein